MTKFENNINTSASSVRLSDAEKERMKNVLQSYMRFHPLPEPVTTYTITRDWFVFLQRPLAASLVLVLVVGSGVSYAAEGALPGDTLYAVKTNVNESLKIALAGSAEAKAEVEIELTERRIEEAAALAADDRLDEATEAKLAVALDAHAESAATLVEEIDEDDAGAAAELSARFETRLRAREDVLAEVRNADETERGVETSVQRSIRTASSRVALLRERAEVRLALAPALGGNPEEEPTATMAMKAAPMALPARSADTAASLAMSEDLDATAATNTEEEPTVERKTAERMQNAAEIKLKEVRKKARKSEKARSELEAAENLIEEGDEYLEDGDYTAAFFSFRASLEQSERTSVFFDSANILKKARSKNTRTQENTPEKREQEETRGQKEEPSRESGGGNTTPRNSEGSGERDEQESEKKEETITSPASKIELDLDQELNLSL